MTELVSLERRGPVGVVVVDNPPVNALSPGVPEGIRACLERANADEAVKAIVIMGAGRGFIAGADIKHLGARKFQTRRNQDIIEENDKPVVAAIHGFALGGGLELALGCHYRLAVRSAMVGLPEVLIGIIPGGGGTQRLPRLIGIEPALDMIVSGRHVPAEEALTLGILDTVVDDNALKSEAIAFAQQIIGRPLRRVGQMNEHIAAAIAAREVGGADPFAAMEKKIARRARNQRAPYACIEAVRAAVDLPLEQGLAREREIIESLVNADEAKALRYIFFAERKARDVPHAGKGVQAPAIRSGAVVGGGTMGSGIAMTFADAGVPVRLLEVSKAALDKAMDRIRSTYAVSVKRGSLSESAVQKRLGLICPVERYEDIVDADIVIEAVFEDMQVKTPVFEQLDRVMKPDAVLASNTSALDIDTIAAATKRPESVLGTHFFSPANVMKLLEIVRGEKTAPGVLASSMQLARQLSKVGVVSGNCDGFTANRSRIPFNIEMNILIEEGATPAQVDKVMVDFGYPMGPFAVADLAGGDIGHAGRQRRKAQNPATRMLPIADRLVERGRYGQKTAGGWYDYAPGDRSPRESVVTAAVIEEVRREMGINTRSISEEEILRRILFSSLNEACKILEEGIAYRPSDIDAMWVNGFGFPRYRGGLMYWADQIGVKTIHEQMLTWHATLGERWRPAALLQSMANDGRAFANL